MKDERARGNRSDIRWWTAGLSAIALVGALSLSARAVEAGVVGGSSETVGCADTEEIRPESFDLTTETCGVGLRVGVRRTVDGHPLTLAGKVYEHGFGTCPESAVGFRSDGSVVSFSALVGLDDRAEEASRGRKWKPAAEFKVWADGRIVWRSGERRLGEPPVPVEVSLAGAREIVLETSGGGGSTSFLSSYATWADARFTCRRGVRLAKIEGRDLQQQLGILTPPEKETPQINGADIWGVRPGHPVLFRVATSGARPMVFSARGLPSGVTLDATRGILGGVAPQQPGDYDIEVTARNAKGEATRTIRLAVGDTIALTPPMGWNSWNVWCYRLTAEHVEAAARAMDESGLGDHGWAYINLDDWWAMNNSGCPRAASRKEHFGGRDDVTGPARDADGNILPNRAFPDMKGLVDRIHARGFKAGIYSSPGALTCGKCEGSYGHEAADAARWAEWGFDYLKYDWCSYGDVFMRELAERKETRPAPFVRHPDYEKPYRLMGDCLRRQNRDIVFSLCQYGMGKVEEWAREAGAQCWRSCADLKDAWTWLEVAIESRIGGEYWKYAGRGCWADPDMLVVGRQYSFDSDHPSYLTPNEQYTHVSLWCLIGSPLLVGCDLANLDAFTRSLLVNDEVIAVSQDRLGKIARRVRHTDAESVWCRPLADGSIAVGLVNRYPYAREISVSAEEVGIGFEFSVRDLWRQHDEGYYDRPYAVRVPAHATKFVKMKTVCCGEGED